MSDYETRMRQRQIGRDLLSQSQEAMGAAADVAVPMPEHASLISTYAKACVEATAPLIVAAELERLANEIDNSPSYAPVTAEDVRARAAQLRGEDTWCNCQAIRGTANYPGPWHPKGDEVGCLRFGRASVLRGEGPTGVSDEELPGMWSNADLSGGQTEVGEGEQ